MQPVRSGGRADASGNGSATNARNLYSLVLASDYRVDDVERMWSSIKDQHSPLAGIGAHHVVLYASIFEPGRVLVTIGIRNRRPIDELLRSPAVFEWFDMAGVNDIPAVFAGEVLEKIDLAECQADTIPAEVIVVGAVSAVDDVSGLMSKVHTAIEHFRAAGVRKLRLYRAVDDGHEVLTLLEVDSLLSAQRWIDHPDATAEWMSSPAIPARGGSSAGESEAGNRAKPGMAAYPSLFVGKLAHVMSVEAIR